MHFLTRVLSTLTRAATAATTAGEIIDYYLEIAHSSERQQLLQINKFRRIAMVLQALIRLNVIHEPSSHHNDLICTRKKSLAKKLEKELFCLECSRANEFQFKLN
jgi:hypothetical protein